MNVNLISYNYKWIKVNFSAIKFNFVPIKPKMKHTESVDLVLDWKTHVRSLTLRLPTLGHFLKLPATADPRFFIQYVYVYIYILIY